MSQSAVDVPASSSGGATPAASLAPGRWAAAWARFRAWSHGFPNTWCLWPLLLALTALGGFLRFWRIDHQSYWHDESRTITRIAGSLHDLLGSLESQGFPPGWYILLRGWTMLATWWNGNAVAAFAPATTRALPALLGTLMVPAMYFLGRQFTDRRGALLVGLLTAVNPFLIYYSRDIKMYMACWLFLVLHTALFFKWQTTHRHWLWWPLFVLAGVATVSMHASAWFIVALELLWLLTRPRMKSLDGMLWVVALGVMTLVPLYWYTSYSTWVTARVEGVRDAGLDWIRDYTDMSWTTVFSLPCSHLLGFLYPEWPLSARTIRWYGLGPTFTSQLDTHTLGTLVDLADVPGGGLLKLAGIPTALGLQDLQRLAALLVFAVMFLGLFPWRGRRSTYEGDRAATRGRSWWIGVWIAVPMLALASTWVELKPLHALIWDKLGLNPQALWEPRYLGIVAPAFILWLAAAMRRLPTWPLRALVIGLVLSACTVSALSNHLIYRQSPWQQIVDVTMRHWDPSNPNQLALGLPWTRFPGEADIYHINLARGIHPKPMSADMGWENRDPFIHGGHVRRNLGDESLPYDSAAWNLPYTAFLDQMRADPSVKTIVMTDRHGERTDPKDVLSNEQIARRLGPRWKLVEERSDRWYYEWRFYFYHTWRTRVWVRQQ